MISRSAVPSTLSQTAELQAGMLSRAQVLRAGISDRVIARLCRQRWLQVAPGVYSVRDEPSWLGWAWAGLLIGGPGSVLGLAAAGHLNQLMPAPDQLAIWVGEHRQVRTRWPWHFIRGQRIGVGSPPRTDRIRTILDLAAVQPSDALLNLLSEAVGRRGVTPSVVLDALAQLPRHPRRKLLIEVLGDVTAGVRSPLERRFLRDVERAHGLPVAERQESPSGRHQVDAWYREFGVVAELDGRAFHEGRNRFRDFERDNRHALLSLTTLRYGWNDTINNPCSVARQLVAMFRLHGWTRVPKSCPRCANRPWP
ncbi:MAG TPA: type IV toxin-antitoxin system AbiEi family antitoxin domain-containing protein [Propionicimonas sp.]|nr:type IV toxin-antitoxin system AbiEi family antitoxin domain-containing protein [Propionicimonas sp.]HQA77486.1 type IV toxin-antitoxin system AbiEi family antitoxin domain-containing protein [Propionicimonas sp.]HQD97261.1 type IV toxin-antitoxin system AbiEi family antitoxin domain-containing protein [Propionicimonas sp.]